jgi:serine/threonine protein kinase
MQIQCPHCSATLQLGVPTPGRYKPKCKKCDIVFLIDVSADDPPKIRIGKRKTSTKHPQRPSEKAPQPGEDGQSVAAATPASPVPPDGESDQDLTPVPARLGGYRIVRMLGRGAMGAVYQAKQVSLDRDVALKTIRGRLADNPASLARFTREAYAAAQLSHHNVVQIYDFGHDEGQHYFSMEWIRGGSLADLVREKGSIDPKLAATYILQAARGLQFAHRSGMVHRDIKPANLLLSEDGFVKVADLGLVKVPDQVDADFASEGLLASGLQSGTQVTMQGTAVGTPAYMAPEQSADASTVDHRADIYSLGCSLFYLLAGRSPYPGTGASEVVDQHAHAPLPDLAQINARVPTALCEIVSCAMAKRPGDRYGSLAEMIDELQAFLGVESMTGFSPSSDQADRWETIATEYSKTQRLKALSGKLFAGLAAVSMLITIVAPLIWTHAILLGPTLLIVTCLVAIVLGETIGKGEIADHARRWAGTLSRLEIAAILVALFMVLLITLVSGCWIGVLIGSVLGSAIGVAYHFGVTAAAAKAGQKSLEDARRFVRDLRLDGADEIGLRDFLARYAGQGWQAIYEALFGFDAFSEARHRLMLDPSFSGPCSDRAIRDRVCSALTKKTQANREANDRKKLAELEQNSLLSQGVSAADAREQSWQMASAIMESAQTAVDQSEHNEKIVAEAKRKRVKAMLADARSGRYKRPRDRFAAVKFALSGFSRLLAGCLLLAAFTFAVRSLGLLREDAVETVTRTVRSGEVNLDSLPVDANTDAFGLSTSLWSLGIAGVLLCLSAFISGWRMTPFAIAATLVILFGAPIGIPAIGPASPWMVAASIGVAIYLPGILFGEEKS